MLSLASSWRKFRGFRFRALGLECLESRGVQLAFLGFSGRSWAWHVAPVLGIGERCPNITAEVAQTRQIAALVPISGFSLFRASEPLIPHEAFRVTSVISCWATDSIATYLWASDLVIPTLWVTRHGQFVLQPV